MVVAPDPLASAQRRHAPDALVLTDASHVRNAIARFDQVEGVTDQDREEAWRRIQRAAKKFDVEVEARSWRDLMRD